MVKIRMRREGGKNDISFRLVATDSRSPRDGKYIERLGWYDPKKKGVNWSLNMERIDYWVKNGAQVSSTVASIVKKAKKAAAAAPIV